MKKFKDFTLENYLNVLSKKVPVPGGGSAAALTAALGAALVTMVANYSKGKSKSKVIESKLSNILRQSEQIRKRLTVLIDLDAQAYLSVVKARGKPVKIKKQALKKAASIPREVSRLCYKEMKMTPYLVKHGNQYLISDIIVAADLLLAAFNSARINVEANK